MVFKPYNLTMASDIENIEFFSRLNPKRLTSLDEDARNERTQILADQRRFAKYGTNNAKLAALMESGQLMPAAELVRVREEEAKRAAEFEAAVQSERSHSKTRIPRLKVEIPIIYTREPVDE